VKPIVLVPFASPIHGKEYCAAVLDSFKRHFEGHDIAFAQLVDSVEKADKIGKEYRDYLPIALVLTGGTSRLVRRFVEAGVHERLILLAHGEHNSLPSATSIRAKLESEGIYVWLYYCDEHYAPECRDVVTRAMRVAYAVAKILGSRIGVVGVEEKSEAMSDFEARFGAEIELIGFEDFENLVESVTGGKEVEEFVDYVKKSLELRLSDEKLPDVARIYVALRRLFKEKKLDGIAMECFEYIARYGIAPCLALAKLNAEGFVTACEADVPSLFLMLLSFLLTGSSGWMANLSRVRGDRVYLAHCTVPLSMVRRAFLVDHFETGKPYAVSGELSTNVATMVSISSDFSLMVAELVRIEKSGFLGHGLCRTGALLELEFPTEEIPLVAPANHHVLIPGDVRSELRVIAELLGIDFVTYRELVEIV